MGKYAMIQYLAGWLAMVMLAIGFEFLVAFLCYSVFGMSEIVTVFIILLIWCIVLIFAYYHNKSKYVTSKVKHKEQVQENFSVVSGPHCPYCFSINTLMDSDGYCSCFDCKAIWQEE